MHPNRAKAFHKRCHSGAAGTLQQLITPARRDHKPSFDQLLPKAMAELVAEGLFVRDPTVEGGYRITDLGRARLAELEGK
jgi:hypothetical protein